MSKKVCVFGTLHEYQCDVYRPQFINELSCLAKIYSVDTILEEANVELWTIPRVWAKKKAQLPWVAVDLNREEREVLLDENPTGDGSLIDFSFNNARERAWVERTASAIKVSGLFLCGCVHTLSVAQKFISAGLEVRVHAFIDRSDQRLIREATFDSPEWLSWPLSSNET